MPNPMTPILSLTVCSLVACTAPTLEGTSESASPSMMSEATIPASGPQDLRGLSTAYFGAGCFWVEEAMFEDLKGVAKVYSGYSGGTTTSPSYEMVCSGTTGHAEAVEVYYDPKVIDYATLLKVFFGSQDPRQVNGQGPDKGTQYRSVVFYRNDTEKSQAQKMIAELNAKGDGPIATQVVPFEKFWKAEDYHQGYEKLHPDQPYVATVSKRRYDAFRAKFPELVR
jgi:peptide-methionine (S)-S-oxide reductase